MAEEDFKNFADTIMFAVCFVASTVISCVVTQMLFPAELSFGETCILILIVAGLAGIVATIIAGISHVKQKN